MHRAELSRREIVTLYNLLDSLDGKYNPKVKYAITKNKGKLKEEFDSINEMRKSNVEKFVEFEKKHMELVQGSIAHGDDGLPIQESPGSYRLKPECIDSFKAKTMLLEEEYKDAIEERNKEMVEVNALLDAKVQVVLFLIDMEDVPEELSQKQYDAFFPLVKNNEQEEEGKPNVSHVSHKKPEGKIPHPNDHRH